MRAHPLLNGDTKNGSNFAATHLTYEQTKGQGLSDHLYLYNEYLTEANSSNVFIHMIDEDGNEVLRTYHGWDGVILNGVMRDTLIKHFQQKY